MSWRDSGSVEQKWAKAFSALLGAALCNQKRAEILELHFQGSTT